MIWHICQGLKPLKKCLGYVKDEEGNKMKYILFKGYPYFPPKKKKSAFKDPNSKKQRNTTAFDIGFTTTKSVKVKDKHIRYSAKSVMSTDKKKLEKEKIKRRQTASTKEMIKYRHHYKDKSRKSTHSNFSPKESENELETGEDPNQDQMIKLDDYELNQLDYEEAIKYDQRSWFQTYIYLVKMEHRLIFTFFVYKDYNIIPIKWSKFCFLLATDMCMNVFFFSDATMHKIFLSYGKYDFIQQVPQIIYSTIISQIIEVLLCFLSLTNKHMYEIKSMEQEKRDKETVGNIFKTMSRKIFFYFLITFLLFLAYWYIVAVFCAVYENTQITYIKDSLFSSLLSLIFPFILYIFPSAFRGCALKCKNNNCLYKLSEIIPFF